MRNCWFKLPERGPRGSLWCRTVYLINDAIKILGIHFSYHDKTKTAEFLKHRLKNTERSQCMEYKNTYFRRKDSNL